MTPNPQSDIDEPNARLIAATRARAQHVFRWG
jgi:hypothetical protein